LLLWAALAAGCKTAAVGDPCLPEQVPEDGFEDSEAYVESSSVQCETRVCLVYHLDGDPREDCPRRQASACVPSEQNNQCDGQPKAPKCATPDEVERLVYCTCRCDTGDTGFAECECPSGFSCAPVIAQGGAGVRGRYCVRNDTLAEP